MCGIAGYVKKTLNEKFDINSMLYELHERGPEESGIWKSESGRLILGQTRLAINDLHQTGHQPMVSKDMRYIIVLNGEIYNFLELRKKMNDFGFRGHSDTEVFLELIARDGLEKTLENSKGMFAFCVYDTLERVLYLARDRFGEKPLYYGWVNGNFIFASTANAISAIDNFNNKINKNVLGYYFKNKYIPAPYSIYSDIFKLEPGRILKFDIDKWDYSICKYWDLDCVIEDLMRNPFKGTYREAKELLDVYINKSVEYQMIADVPVGAFLSGGIDSSLISAIMQKQSAKKINTFSIGFQEQKDDEARYAKEIAKHIGSNHTELYVSEQDMIDVIPKLPHIYGEPFGDTSEITTYLVSKMAKEKVTVSLSGDAGDELFYGYDEYELLKKRWNFVSKFPFRTRYSSNKLNTVLYKCNIYQKYHLLKTYFSAHNVLELSQLVSERNILVNNFAKSDSILQTEASKYIAEKSFGTVEDLMIKDLKTFIVDDILVKVDRAAMANSLETRVPLLDIDVVKFALSLPFEYKYENGVRKKILKDLAYEYVPKELLERPKTGFNVKVEKWIKDGQLRMWAEELLDYGEKNCEEYINFKAVRFAWNRFIEKGIWIENIWYVLVFIDWYKFYYKK